MTDSSTAPNTPESPMTSGIRRIRQTLRQSTRPLRRAPRPDAVAGPSSAMFTTIRNRLIFSYIAILTAILLLLGLLLYFAMQQTLFASGKQQSDDQRPVRESRLAGKFRPQRSRNLPGSGSGNTECHQFRAGHS